nr:SURF1 family cytochrome oxidase biogenesis protein [Nesterenkonia sp. AN1]
MLKTALQPKWIGTLALALVLATVFVVLSAWQFSESSSEPPPTQEITENPVPLTEVHAPMQPMTVAQADQIVELSGEFLADTQVIIDERLQDGTSGYWVVAAFRPEDAPDENIIRWCEAGSPIRPMPRSFPPARRSRSRAGCFLPRLPARVSAECQPMERRSSPRCPRLN